MIKKTLLSVAVSATLFSLEASANNNARANSATSATTQASVGHRPVATPNGGKDLEVSGKLITGEKLTINKFFITDADGDGEGADGKESNFLKTIANVEWRLVKGNSEALLATNSKSLTIPAEAAGGKIKITYKVQTATGTPDTAILPTSVILTPDNSGVEQPNNGTDGTVNAKLTGIKIQVTNPNGDPNDKLNGVPDDASDKASIPVVGGTLTAILTCAVQSDCDGYNFQWSMGNSANGPFDEKLGTGQTHQVMGDQQGKYFSVEVTPQPTQADVPVSKAKRR